MGIKYKIKNALIDAKLQGWRRSGRATTTPEAWPNQSSDAPKTELVWLRKELACRQGVGFLMEARWVVLDRSTMGIPNRGFASQKGGQMAAADSCDRRSCQKFKNISSKKERSFVRALECRNKVARRRAKQRGVYFGGFLFHIKLFPLGLE